MEPTILILLTPIITHHPSSCEKLWMCGRVEPNNRFYQSCAFTPFSFLWNITKLNFSANFKKVWDAFLWPFNTRPCPLNSFLSMYVMMVVFPFWWNPICASLILGIWPYLLARKRKFNFSLFFPFLFFSFFFFFDLFVLFSLFNFNLTRSPLKDFYLPILFFFFTSSTKCFLMPWILDLIVLASRF